MAYISNCLTHWVGQKATSDEARYDILVNRILANRELLFSPCPWHFCSKYGGVTNFALPMICFTDIPFSEVGQHCKRYSPFGVSFAKSHLASCLASPVGYILSPFAYSAYSYLFHSLSGLAKVIDGQTITEGKYAGRKCDAQQLMASVQELAEFLQNYDIPEFVFNEMQPHPRPDQLVYFDNPASLYYEREWKMVERQGSKFLWDVHRDGKHYFRFEARYVRFIIMPRTFLCRFATEMDVCLKEYPHPRPSLLAYEDLAFF